MASVLAITEVLLTGIVLMLLVPMLVLCIQVAAARARHEASAQGEQISRPRLAVLMPAHDEAAVIARPIGTVLAQLQPRDRLLVVADNCSDDTARIARALGAEVVERSDPSRRGKGFALDHGVRHLAADPCPVVVVVDADCDLGPRCLDLLGSACARDDVPVQALYLMRAPAGAGLKTRVAEFAWIVRNHVRPLGSHRLGWPCQLMGTGMAFPWSTLASASLATGHIVEDMKLGLDLALAGSPPQFCGGALVVSEFPKEQAALATQRTRWEHGHLSLIAESAVPLLKAAFKEGRPGLAALALDLCVPPLASLSLVLAAVWTGAAVVLALGGAAYPLVAASLALMLLLWATGTAWSRFARHVLSAADWLAVPAYILAKVPLYARLFTARQVEWVRTRRNTDGD
ncbi:MAG TPA: glycosyltransferase family 2 protein [Caldimonas sp.]|jgi:cellulose synthase/poly-beta-1,6-N-acetylglucosamine synthase-like glycosyltransferase|nr:glycosyltransferase family 2 protein [Caldimonas sp.]HEX2542204.1 glycosyltransferase family 2 protein [Caldimonas sp.]